MYMKKIKKFKLFFMLKTLLDVYPLRNYMKMKQFWKKTAFSTLYIRIKKYITMETNFNFHNDLSVANKYERWVSDYFISKKMHKKVLYFNNNYMYDYKFKDNNNECKTIEVKHDYQTKTGNICIEYKCRGKNSCLNTTLSDFYVFIFPLLDELWLIKTNDLKKLIDECKKGIYEENWTSNLKFTQNIPGGDDMQSRLYLLNRDDFRHKFKVIKTYIPTYV